MQAADRRRYSSRRSWRLSCDIHRSCIDEHIYEANRKEKAKLQRNCFWVHPAIFVVNEGVAIYPAYVISFKTKNA